MPPPDHDRLDMLLAALGGAALYGTYLIATILLAGQSPTRTDYLKAGVNIACACIAGVLITWFLGANLVALIPLESLRVPKAVGFMIGAAAWELIPAVFAMIKRRGQSEIDKLGGGQ